MNPPCALAVWLFSARRAQAHPGKLQFRAGDRLGDTGPKVELQWTFRFEGTEIIDFAMWRSSLGTRSWSMLPYAVHHDLWSCPCFHFLDTPLHHLKFYLSSARLKKPAFPRRSERKKKVEIADLSLFVFRNRKAVTLLISHLIF